MSEQNRTKEILKTIRCCRDKLCTKCPLQAEICDELWVDMETIPAELIDRIGDALEEALKRKQ